MAHNRLVMMMDDIPQSVRDSNDAFWLGIFNSNVTKRQLDGYKIDSNENIIEPATLVHTSSALLYWCRDEENPQAVVDNILANSYTMKPSEYKVLRSDPESEWYAGVEI